MAKRRFRNSRRENELEELGRVDAEKGHTSEGKRNLRQEKRRIVKEVSERHKGYATGGRAARRPMTPDQKRKPKKAGPKAPKPKQKSLIDQYRKHKRDIFLKDLKEHNKPRKPGDPPRIREPKLPRPDRDRKMTPLKEGGSPKKPRPQGPHMWVRGDKRKKYASGGVVMAGKKVGGQIK